MRLLSLIVTTALLLSVTLVEAMPAAAAPAAPLITASSGWLSPPRVLAVDTVSVGQFGLAVTFGRIDALPVGEFSATLYGRAHIVRVFGCVAADGTRLRDRDVVVEQDSVLYTGRGIPLSRAPGQSSITGRVFHEFDNGPMPDCPTGSSAALLSIKVSSVTLQLSTLGENPVTFDYTVPGSWGWAGAATEAIVPPITAGPLQIYGYSVQLLPPTSPGAAAGCPAVNGCGRIEVAGAPYRPGDRSTLLRGALKASGTLVRTYGCVTAAGRRLHRYDTRVVEPGRLQRRTREGVHPGCRQGGDPGDPGRCPGRRSARQLPVRYACRALPDRGQEAGDHPGGLHQNRTADRPQRFRPVELVRCNPDRIRRLKRGTHQVHLEGGSGEPPQQRWEPLRILIHLRLHVVP